MNDAAGKTVLFYDGVCGLCNRLTRFVLDRDRHDRVRYASLQSELAQVALARHGHNPGELDSVWVLVDFGLPTERALNKSRAILWLLRCLGGVWALAAVLALVPRFLRDFVYDRIARRRYRIWGKLDACPLPRAGDRAKFLDASG